MKLSSLQALAAASAARGDFSGVVRLQQGEQIDEAAYGLAHRGWQIQNTPQVRFRLASVSKMFTALAVLQWIERGALQFDTRIVDYLDLTDVAIPETVEIRHLLTMTAGIADWFDESGDWEANWANLCREHPLYLLRSDADYLPLFAAKPPLAPPGEAHVYSNASYILLGLAIQKASGMSCPDAVRKQIFAPLGMDSSNFLSLDGVDPLVAEGYLPGEGSTPWRKNVYAATPEAAADGGAFSTAGDLVRFSQGLRQAARGENSLLSPELARAMLTPQVRQSTEKIRGCYWYYGFGTIFMLRAGGDILRWGHTGEEEGVSCRLYYYPQQNLDVILLGNQSGCSGTLGWEIHEALIEGRAD